MDSNTALVDRVEPVKRQRWNLRWVKTTLQLTFGNVIVSEPRVGLATTCVISQGKYLGDKALNVKPSKSFRGI